MASLLLLLVVGCFTGCFNRTGPSYTFVNSNIPHRPMHTRTPDQVELFASAPPKLPYVEVGILQMQGGIGIEPGTVLEVMRAEAGRLGCEGVIIVGTNDSVEGESNKYWGSTTTLKGFNGVCILFEHDAENASAP